MQSLLILIIANFLLLLIVISLQIKRVFFNPAKDISVANVSEVAQLQGVSRHIENHG